MKTPNILLVLLALCGMSPVVAAADDSSERVKYSPADVEKLVAPIALYPDALLGVIFPASTNPADIVLAARFLEDGGDAAQIDKQPWDESVRALARYPDVLRWMDENLAWTQQLGITFLDQQDDVMAAVQRLRAQAKTAGNLTSTSQQTVIFESEYIRIVPSDPEVIYVPYYDPAIVYYLPARFYFGPAWPCGPWLRFDCNWISRSIWLGAWAPLHFYQPAWRPMHRPLPPNFMRTHTWRPPPAHMRPPRPRPPVSGHIAQPRPPNGNNWQNPGNARPPSSSSRNTSRPANFGDSRTPSRPAPDAPGQGRRPGADRPDRPDRKEHGKTQSGSARPSRPNYTSPSATFGRTDAAATSPGGQQQNRPAVKTPAQQRQQTPSNTSARPSRTQSTPRSGFGTKSPERATASQPPSVPPAASTRASAPRPPASSSTRASPPPSTSSSTSSSAGASSSSRTDSSSSRSTTTTQSSRDYSGDNRSSGDSRSGSSSRGSYTPRDSGSRSAPQGGGGGRSSGRR